MERIFNSYKKMKEAQKESSSVYKPSSLWQAQLNDSYSFILESTKENDIKKFHFFLSNFGSWKKYHGVATNVFMNKSNKTLIGRRYLKNVIFYRQLQMWKWFYNKRKHVRELESPIFGNQSGSFIDGKFIGVISFFNEIYGSLLSGLVKDKKSPVIAELGAGSGNFAYYILKHLENDCYVDFDLPETLCLGAYYLMMTWPDKKVLLYGEEDYSEFSHTKYDLIFMPSFEIEKIGNNSIDIFINKNSLGEMTRKSARNYLKYISQSSNYIFHMNHDVFPNVYSDGESGLLGYEYPISTDDFLLLFRYPDMGHMITKGGIDYSMDIFLYLYKRK